MIDTTRPPEWLTQVRDHVVDWAQTVMDDEHPGLFRMCADAYVPWDLQSSAKGLHILERHDALAPVAAAAKEAGTIELLQDLQDEETGFFRDPHFEPHFAGRDEPAELLGLRRNNAKWGKIALERLGAEPRRSFFRTGSGGDPDPEAVLAMIRDANWDEPWGAGSHAAQAVRELFFLVCEGRDEFKPAVEEGMGLVMSHQNPETGMVGGSHIPLFQQISGALKVIGTFQFSLGFKVPYLDKLADSCVDHHRDGGFYAESGSHCIPRNVAEMVWVCLIHSDYREPELREVLVELAEQYQDVFGKPDGGYSPTPEGTQAYTWNGTVLSEESETPRSSISGTNGSGCLGMICEALGWEVGFPSMHRGWEERVAALPWEAQRHDDGSIRLVERAA